MDLRNINVEKLRNAVRASRVVEGNAHELNMQVENLSAMFPDDELLRESRLDSRRLVEKVSAFRNRLEREATKQVTTAVAEVASKGNNRRRKAGSA